MEGTDRNAIHRPVWRFATGRATAPAACTLARALEADPSIPLWNPVTEGLIGPRVRSGDGGMTCECGRLTRRALIDFVEEAEAAEVFPCWVDIVDSGHVTDKETLDAGPGLDSLAERILREPGGWMTVPIDDGTIGPLEDVHMLLSELDPALAREFAAMSPCGDIGIPATECDIIWVAEGPSRAMALMDAGHELWDPFAGIAYLRDGDLYLRVTMEPEEVLSHPRTASSRALGARGETIGADEVLAAIKASVALMRLNPDAREYPIADQLFDLAASLEGQAEGASELCLMSLHAEDLEGISGIAVTAAEAQDAGRREAETEAR